MRVYQAQVPITLAVAEGVVPLCGSMDQQHHFSLLVAEEVALDMAVTEEHQDRPPFLDHKAMLKVVVQVRTAEVPTDTLQIQAVVQDGTRVARALQPPSVAKADSSTHHFWEAPMIQVLRGPTVDLEEAAAPDTVEAVVVATLEVSFVSIM